jgi:hypothetical protein
MNFSNIKDENEIYADCCVIYAFFFCGLVNILFFCPFNFLNGVGKENVSLPHTVGYESSRTPEVGKKRVLPTSPQ